MKYVSLIYVSLIICLLCLCTNIAAHAQTDPASYVDPRIGTFGGGETFPGAIVPWGMVSISPQHRERSDGRYDFLGLSHVNLSGVGCTGLGNIVMMPGAGPLRATPAEYDYRYENWNTHQAAGLFEIYIAAEQLSVQATVTERAAISRWTFPQRKDDATILFHVSADRGTPMNSFVEFISPTELRGWHTSVGFCNDRTKRTIYFHAIIDKTPVAYGTWENGVQQPNGQKAEGKEISAYLQFATEDKEQIHVRTGISYVSMDNARLNLTTELPDWDFTAAYQRAIERWNRELGKIAVRGDEMRKTTFYTALYHSLIHPNIYSDVNGEYPSMRDYSTLKAEGYTRYTVFSLWDTYRTVHPLLCLVYPERQVDMARTLVEHYKENGWLAQWELPGGESNAMLGDPAGLVLLDTYLRNLPVDIATAAEGAAHNATETSSNRIRPGLQTYMNLGYIPIDRDPADWSPAPVSSTLEYAIADWAAARLAYINCNAESWTLLSQHSRNYETLFDKSTGFFRPRNANSSWLTPFVPESEEGGDFPGSGGPGFAEGHAWHYRFYTSHDWHRLVELHGGQITALQRLQEFFDKSYFRWNEHNMAYPYMFTRFDNEAWRTQKLVRVLAESFDNANTGIPGNDDAGAISSWYVWTSMGLYPLQAGVPEYSIGSMLFDTVDIALNPQFYTGSAFRLVSVDNTKENPYIQATRLNGTPYNWYSISHSNITRGGELHFVMSSGADNPGYTASPVPDPLSPRLDTLLSHPMAVLRWTAKPGAQSTKLQVFSVGSECSMLVDTVLHGTSTEFVFAELLPLYHYTWRVQHSFETFESGWSEEQAFKTDQTLDSNYPLVRSITPSLWCYPTPLRSEPLSVVYYVPVAGQIRLSIVDILGIERSVLFVGYAPKGLYTTVWNNTLAYSGAFFLKLETSHGTTLYKLTILPE